MPDDAIDILNNAAARLSAPLHPRVPEEVFRSVLAAFEEADEAGRVKVTERLSRESGAALLAFASELAASALRRNSPELIRLGLLAVGVEGGRCDIRDDMTALALLYHSAAKLGLDAAASFSKVAALVPATDPRLEQFGTSVKKELAGFPSRPPESRNLKAFGFRERMSNQGLIYEDVRCQPPFRVRLRLVLHNVRSVQPLGARLRWLLFGRQ
ncbi:MAG TPA: hypothetical protein VN893_17245 [Bryobacteraceae bacterium]|nr:hypothetical protein [Bryobacteraceae bacterium]